MVNGSTPIANEKTESDSDYHNMLCTSVQFVRSGSCEPEWGRMSVSKRRNRLLKALCSALICNGSDAIDHVFDSVYEFAMGTHVLTTSDATLLAQLADQPSLPPPTARPRRLPPK